MEDQEQLQGMDPDCAVDFTQEDLEPRAFKAPPRRRVLWTLGILAAIGVLVVVPPLVNVNRFQKQIAQSISLSLGRPVHTGPVTLDLLPWPGFTIANFVVSEDPAFGSEPVIRASSVRARLRWRSLWRRRMEFSRITLSDASVNLVRRADGKWNLESILLQASRMPAAPTAQRGPGDRARFPYIEATGARVNVKSGLEKLPISLTEADFALWLPEAEQWRLRLEAHPARTDTAATDTGSIRLEGTLGRAMRLPEVPVDVHASWTAAPLGAVSYVLTGRDAGLRGELDLNVNIKGTAGDNAFTSSLRMTRVRREDFVPPRLMDVDIACTAHALGNLHRLEDVHCTWPAGETTSGLEVTGAVPDTLAPGTAALRLQLTALPAAALVDALRLVSRETSPRLIADGTVSAHATCCTPDRWFDEAALDSHDARLALAGGSPFLAGEVHGEDHGDALAFDSIPLDLGGATPAMLNLSITRQGYRMALNGPAERERVLALAAALPPFGQGLAALLPPGLPATVVLNAVSERAWGGPQQWSTPATPKPVQPRKGRRRR